MEKDRDSKGRFKKKHSLNNRRKRQDVVKRNKSENPPRNTGRTRFKKGDIGYWFGKKRSFETIDKLRIAHMGRESWNKGKKCPQLSGKNNGSWKGGVTKKTNKIRNSLEYINWRVNIFKRDNFTCQKCRIIGKNLNAHHILPFSLLIETPLEKLIFDNNNGVTLCVDCHKEEHPELNLKIKKNE